MGWGGRFDQVCKQACMVHLSESLTEFYQPSLNCASFIPAEGDEGGVIQLNDWEGDGFFVCSPETYDFMSDDVRANKVNHTLLSQPSYQPSRHLTPRSTHLPPTQVPTAIFDLYDREDQSQALAVLTYTIAVDKVPSRTVTHS